MGLKNPARLLAAFLAGVPVCLFGQTMVEHAAISGAGTAAAASAKSAGSALGNALKKLDRTSAAAAGKTQSAPTHPVAESKASPAAPAEPRKPERLYEDPAGIKVGLSSSDLLERFGQAAMTVTGDAGEQTLYYSGKDGRQTAVRLRDGKVVSVT